MARDVNISGGAGGGVGSDELTSLLSDVVKGKLPSHLTVTMILV